VHNIYHLGGARGEKACLLSADRKDKKVVDIKGCKDIFQIIVVALNQLEQDGYRIIAVFKNNPDTEKISGISSVFFQIMVEKLDFKS